MPGPRRSRLAIFSWMVLALGGAHCGGSPNESNGDTTQSATTAATRRSVLFASTQLTGHLVADDTHVYWTESDRSRLTVKKMPVGGGPVTTVITQSRADVGGVVAFAADAANLYLATNAGNTHTLQKIAKSDGSLAVVTSGFHNIGGFTVDATDAYIGLVLNSDSSQGRERGPSNGVIERVSLAGGAPVTIVENAASKVDQVAVDDKAVYWIDLGRHGDEGNDGVLLRAPKDPSSRSLPPTVIASNAGKFTTEARFVNLAQDAQTLYFTSGIYGGNLGAWAKDGSSQASVLFHEGNAQPFNGPPRGDGTPRGVVLDATGLYFSTSREAFGAGGDVILRMNFPLAAGAPVTKIDDTDDTDPAPRDSGRTKRAFTFSLTQNKDSLFFISLPVVGSFDRVWSIVRVSKAP